MHGKVEGWIAAQAQPPSRHMDGPTSEEESGAVAMTDERCKRVAGQVAGVELACEFVRQQCSHRELFQPHYKRSNRTKGSKILRCFPHCCPDHATRGFCGSSIYVRVTSRALQTPGALPAVHVFGRFRLAHMPRLQLGARVAMDSVTESIQSDEHPMGEWIQSQAICSWSDETWLFEINRAARWFYGWESSTIKAQRLQEHVLDVYVFMETHAPPSNENNSDDAAESAQFLVVGAITSPQFQLISFRRATPDAVQSLSTGKRNVASWGSDSEAAAVLPVKRSSSLPQLHQHQLESKRRMPSPPFPPMLPRRSFPQALPSLHIPSSRFASPPVLPSLRLPPSSAAFSSSHGMAMPSISMRSAQSIPSSPPMRIDDLRASSSTSTLRPPTPHALTADIRYLRETQVLLTLIRHVLVMDAVDLADDIHAEYFRQAARVTQDHLTLDRLRLRCRVPVQQTLWRMLSSPAQPAPPAPRIARELLVLLVELTMWRLFDPQINAAVRAAQEEATHLLLHRDALHARFARLVAWIYRQVDTFLTPLQCELSEILRAAAALGCDVDSAEHRSSNTGQLQAFVAQVRELFISRQEGGHRVHPASAGRWSTVGAGAGPVERGLGLGLGANASAGLASAWFLGDWFCAFDADTVELQQAPRAMCLQTTSVWELLWFWKQFGLVSVRADTSDPFALIISSLFAPASMATSAMTGMRLVLDQRPRWLRCFPCGDSPLANPLRGLRFGDYTGRVDAASGDVDFTFYTWQARHDLSQGQGQDAATGATKFSIQLTRFEHELLAVLCVEDGALDPSVGASQRDLESWALPDKLACVQTWTPAYRAQLLYHRLNARPAASMAVPRPE